MGAEIHAGERSHYLKLTFTYIERAEIWQNINTVNLGERLYGCLPFYFSVGLKFFKIKLWA